MINEKPREITEKDKEKIKYYFFERVYSQKEIYKLLKGKYDIKQIRDYIYGEIGEEEVWKDKKGY